MIAACVMNLIAFDRAYCLCPIATFEVILDLAVRNDCYEFFNSLKDCSLHDQEKWRFVIN